MRQLRFQNCREDFFWTSGLNTKQAYLSFENRPMMSVVRKISMLKKLNDGCLDDNHTSLRTVRAGQRQGEF